MISPYNEEMKFQVYISVISKLTSTDGLENGWHENVKQNSLSRHDLVTSKLFPGPIHMNTMVSTSIHYVCMYVCRLQPARTTNTGKTKTVVEQPAKPGKLASLISVSKA